jgi:uncharacterized protein (TIGR03000 family)
MNARSFRLGVLSFAILVLGGAVSAQEPEKITIKFKLYDTNRPDEKDPIKPKSSALLTIRDQATKRPGFPRRIPVVALADQFWQVELEKNVLIEHLVIEAESTRYSPADLTKIVTRAPINLYPGVSDSLDQFSFSAFSAQMNTYRAIITDLNTALPGRKEEIQKLLGAQFYTQLTNMEQAASDPKRLLTDIPEEIAAARKLANDVLVLYGLRAESPAPTAPCIFVEYYPMFGPCHVRGWRRFHSIDVSVPLPREMPAYCASVRYSGPTTPTGYTTSSENASAPARLIVQLPPDAKLMIDDKATSSTGSKRHYYTPPLPEGLQYVYSLKASFLVDGKMREVNRRVEVRAGQTVSVTFDEDGREATATRRTE